MIAFAILNLPSVLKIASHKAKDSTISVPFLAISDITSFRHLLTYSSL
jgi:hypothetical protein